MAKRRKNRGVSPYIGLADPPPGGGRRPYEPKHLYQYLFDNTDRHGVVLYSLSQLANTAQVTWHKLGNFVADMKKLGYMETYGPRGVRIKVHPSKVDWEGGVYDKLDELKKERK